MAEALSAYTASIAWTASSDVSTHISGPNNKQLVITGGQVSSGGQDAGGVLISAGDAPSTTTAGNVTVVGGDNGINKGATVYINGATLEGGGPISITAGQGATGGITYIRGGPGDTVAGGNIVVQGGQGLGANAIGGDVEIIGGFSYSSNGGAVSISGGNVSDGEGGVVYIYGGEGEIGGMVIIGGGYSNGDGSYAGVMISDGASNPIGFFGATPSVRETVSGSKGDNEALADLITKLANKGLIVDGTE